MGVIVVEFEFANRSRFEFEDSAFDDDMWTEPMSSSFTALDDRTEAQLKSLLTPEQFATLPPRKRSSAEWSVIKQKGADAKKRAGERKAAGGSKSGKKQP